MKNKSRIIEKLNNVKSPLIALVFLLIISILCSPMDHNSIIYFIVNSKVIILLILCWLAYTILHTNENEVIKSLFNPCSPIITLIVGWILTLLATSVGDNKDVHWFVKMLLDNKEILIIILGCWLILAIMYTTNEQKIYSKENDIKLLNKTIKEKESQLNQSSGIILNKYGEFYQFNRRTRFHEVLESFVNNNGIVDCSQIYKYSAKYDKDNINIKLSYEEGYAYEGIEINNILQMYYSINRDYYDRFNEILFLWKKYIINGKEYTSTERLCLETDLLQRIENLLTEIITELSSIDEKSKVKNIDFDTYRLATLLIRMLSNNECVTEFENILEKEEIETFLCSGKRTGILGSILLEDTFIFKHVGNSSKHGRVYFTFNIEIYEENYVVLYTVTPREMDETEKWNVIFEELKNDFINRLKRTGCNIG